MSYMFQYATSFDQNLGWCGVTATVDDITVNAGCDATTCGISSDPCATATDDGADDFAGFDNDNVVLDTFQFSITGTFELSGASATDYQAQDHVISRAAGSFAAMTKSDATAASNA